MLQRIYNCRSLHLCNLAYPCIDRNPCLVKHRIYHSLRQQPSHNSRNLLCVLFAEVTEQSCVQLFIVKRRLQIYLKPVSAFLDISRCGKHQRTADPEVREQHFSLLPVHRLVLCRINKRQRYIFKAKPRHITAAAFLHTYRNKHRLWFNYRMTERPCYLISAAVRACTAVGRSARRYYDAVCINLALTEPYSFYPAVLGYNAFCVRCDNLDAKRTHAFFQCLNYILCTV